MSIRQAAQLMNRITATFFETRGEIDRMLAADAEQFRCEIHHTKMAKVLRFVCGQCLGTAGGRSTSEAKRAASRVNLAKARAAKFRPRCPACGQPASETAPAGCPGHLV